MAATICRLRSPSRPWRRVWPSCWTQGTQTRSWPTAPGKMSVAVVTANRGGVEAEVRRGEQSVGDLVVAAAADAVDELVDDEQAEERGQRERAGGEAVVVGGEPTAEAVGGDRRRRRRGQG